MILDGLAWVIATLHLHGRRALKVALRRHYRRQFLACGANVRFDPASSTIDYGHVTIGDDAYLGPGAVIGRARIGRDVMFGPNVHIRDGNHNYEDVGRTIQASRRGQPGLIEVGDDVWIGEGTTLLRGASVAEGAVIGTRSLVTRPIPPYVVAAGWPCRIVRKRFSDEELREHLRLLGRSQREAQEIIAARKRAMEDVTLDADNLALHGLVPRQT